MHGKENYCSMYILQKIMVMVDWRKFVNFGLSERISDSDGFYCHLGRSSFLMYVY